MAWFSVPHLVQNWVKSLKTDHSHGDIEISLSLHYAHRISGPLLSAVITPAMAIEAFVRLCAEIAYAGLPDSMALSKLASFDGKSFYDRVLSLPDIVGSTVDLPEDIADDVSALINFRNDCAHSTPLRFDKSWEVKS